MNLYHLKYFYDSARLRSLSKAAEANCVGQPAISKAILNLEDELQVNLTLHERNRFNLTDEGAKVYEHCLDVFNSVEKLKDSLTSPSLVRGDVTFACQSSMAESLFVTEAIKKILTTYPDVNVKLSLGRADLVKQWLLDGVIEFALVINNIDFDQFNVSQVNSGCFHLVKSMSYRGSWKQEGVLVTEKNSGVEKLHQKFMAKNNYNLNNKMTIKSWGVIKSFVQQGIGVGFLPDYIVENEIKNAQLKYVEKTNYSIPYEMLLITPKNKYIPSKTKAIIKQFS